MDDIVYQIGEDPITRFLIDEVKNIQKKLPRKTSIKKLQKLAIESDVILREELINFNIKYDFAEVRIHDIRTVGVQGDKRTYCYPAEIEVRKKEKIVLNYKFIDKLSRRIPNEVKGINRVLYTLEAKL